MQATIEDSQSIEILVSGLLNKELELAPEQIDSSEGNRGSSPACYAPAFRVRRYPPTLGDPSALRPLQRPTRSHLMKSEKCFFHSKRNAGRQVVSFSSHTATSRLRYFYYHGLRHNSTFQLDRRIK